VSHTHIHAHTTCHGIGAAADEEEKSRVREKGQGAANGGGGVRMNAGRAPVWDDERGVGGAIDRAVDLVCLLLSTGVCLVVDVKST